MGYVFIVHNGRVRWSAVGKAEESELESMKAVVKQLQKGTTGDSTPPVAEQDSHPKPPQQQLQQQYVGS